MREAAGRHGVSNLRLFGSVARGAETPNSDMDSVIINGWACDGAPSG
ncbi:nucleotidyltransferase domain-containing protein [Jiangella gansuensis]